MVFFVKDGKMKLNKEYQETILAAYDFDKNHFVIATTDEIRILNKSNFKKVGKSKIGLSKCGNSLLDVCGEGIIGRFYIFPKKTKINSIRNQNKVFLTNTHLVLFESFSFDGETFGLDKRVPVELDIKAKVTDDQRRWNFLKATEDYVFIGGEDQLCQAWVDKNIS